MKKSLTLVEIMVASTVFFLLSVSLYFLLHQGLAVRRRIQEVAGGPHTMLINLERLAQEARNRIHLRSGETAFNGTPQNLEFCTVIFDYACNYPRGCRRPVRLAYSFEGGVLTKTIKSFIDGAEISSFRVMEDIEQFSFSYFDASLDPAWQDSWPDAVNFPQGFKISLTPGPGARPLDKYVYLYR
jgi:hypothetical protein